LNLDLGERSIVIRNLSKNTTIEELEKLLGQFGLISKITILYDKYTGVSKE
jgi:RNA recognition motif-containing protein